ncbi:MAG TPA: tetratricopeptide repeat protein, partial [bacterium]
EFGPAAQRLNEASRSDPQGKLTNDALDMMELLRVAAEDSAGLASLCRADLFRRQKHTAAAESLYTELAGTSRNVEIIQKASWRLALLLRASGRSPEALNRLEEILKRYPQSVRASEYLLQIGLVREEDLGDIKGAIEAYEKILLEYPESLAAQDARRRIRRLEKEQT